MKTFEESVESLNWTQEKEPVWLRNYRTRAFEKFRKIGFPDRHHEAWKYIRLESILKTTLRRSDLKDSAELAYSFEIPKLHPKENLLVFVDGIYSPEHSSLQNEKGLSIETFKTSKPEHLDTIQTLTETTLEKETNAFALINAFNFSDGVVIRISENASIENPIRLVFMEDKNVQFKQIYHSKIVVLAEAKSKSNIILEHTGNGFENYFANFNIEIHCQKHSRIHWTTIGENSFHFVTNRVFLSESADFNLVTLNLDQSFVRDETWVHLIGENATCSLAGTSVLDYDAQAYQHTVVNHLVPSCTSRQIYKNILSGNSKTEFNSMVHAHRNAQKSDSNQLNKNLILSDSARAYSRPQLKIYTDDVKATHGSATGPLLNEELFYLRSRGIDPKEAQAVLTFGFAEEVLELIELPLLRSKLEGRIRILLEQTIRKQK